MKKGPIIGTIAVLMVFFIAAGAFAYSFAGKNGFGKNEEARTALENNDYNAFIDAMQTDCQNRINDMSEEKFKTMQENHQQREQRQSEMQASRDLIENAIENADYQSWQDAINQMDNKPMMADKILTEDDFNTLVQMHNARVNKDFETANELAQELGIEPGLGKGMGGNFRGFGDHRQPMHLD